MRLRFKKWNTTTTLFFLTVLAMQGFAQLIPTSQYLIPKLVRFSDLGIFFSTLFLTWSYVGVHNYRQVGYGYGVYIIIWLIILCLSSLMAYLNFGQSVLMGLRPMRKQIVCFLLYFPITKMMETRHLKRKDFVNIMFLVGTFELIIYTLQYLLADIVTFTYLDTSEIRFNSTRLRGAPYLLPVVLGLYCLDNILTGKTSKITTKCFNLMYLIWSILLLGGMCKHRAPFMILVSTIIIGYLIWKKNFSIKVLVGVIGLVVLIGFASNSNIVNSAINGLVSKGGNMDASLSIRKTGQAYYLQKVMASPVFGFGYPNSNNPAAVSASGLSSRYYLSDNGIMGFLYIQGFAGVLWILFLFLKAYKMGWVLYNRKISYLYLLYFIFETANLYIGMHWYYMDTLPFVLVMALMEYDYRHRADLDIAKCEKPSY